MIPNTPTESEQAAVQAAEWVDRLREANAQDLVELRGWLRQSPENFEELMCAAAIDLAIQVLGDRNLPSSAQFLLNTERAIDLAPEVICAAAALAATQHPHIRASIRACAFAITADELAAEGIERLALQQLSQIPSDRGIATLEREALHIARTVARAWLQQRHSRQMPDDPFLMLAHWRERLWVLGARRVDMLIRTRCLGQPIRQVALSMTIDIRAVFHGMSRVYLHLMSTSDEGHPSPSIVFRLLNFFMLPFRR